MHEPLSDVGGVEIVQGRALKGADLVASLLATSSNSTWDDVRPVALFVVTACTSLLQAAVAGPAQSVAPDALRAHMRALVLGYLTEMRSGGRAERLDDR